MNYNNPNDNWKYDPYKGMTDKERMKAGCLQGVAFIVGFIMALIVCIMLSGCTTTKYVPVIERHTDTLIHTQHHRDSIYLHDSTYVRERGDTLYIERWHTAWRDRVRTDTVRLSHTDSVPVPYPVTEYVERKRSAVEWGLVLIGIVALMGGIVWTAWRLKRYLS